MAKPVAVVCADAHLASRTWAHRPIEGDAEYSLSQVVEAAVEYRVPLIAAGDMVDRQVNRSEVAAMLMRVLSSLRSRSPAIECFYVQGQHDMSDPPWFSLVGPCEHVDRRPFEIAGLKFYGLDYRPAGVLQAELYKIPSDTDVLIAHQVWGDFMGSVAAPQGGSHDIPKVRCLLTGDYHETIVETAVGKDGQKMTIFSPGSLCMQAINEPPTKYLSVLHDDLSVTTQQLKTRQVVEPPMICDNNTLDNFVSNIGSLLAEAKHIAVTENLPQRLHKPLLWVHYSGSIDDAGRRIRRAVDDQAHLFLREQRPEKLDNTARAVERKPGQKHATTLESALPNFLADGGRTDIEEPCMRLLQSTDPKAELSRMREEALGGAT
jgi:hypothetical protein